MNSTDTLTSNELYNEYNDFVTRIATRARNKYWWAITEETAIQVGWEAFIRAQEKFLGTEDLGDSSNFYAYMGLKVHWAVVDEVRRKKVIRQRTGGKLVNISKKNLYFEDMERNEMESLLRYDDPEDQVPFDEILSPIKDKKHEYILRGIYQYDLTMASLADTLGISESRVSQIHQTALSKLRRHHSKIDYAA